MYVLCFSLRTSAGSVIPESTSGHFERFFHLCHFTLGPKKDLQLKSPLLGVSGTTAGHNFPSNMAPPRLGGKLLGGNHLAGISGPMPRPAFFWRPSSDKICVRLRTWTSSLFSGLLGRRGPTTTTGNWEEEEEGRNRFQQL